MEAQHESSTPDFMPPILAGASRLERSLAVAQEGRINDLERMHYAEAERVAGPDGLMTLQDSNTLFPDPSDAYSYVLSDVGGVGTLLSQVFHESGIVKHQWHDGENVVLFPSAS